MVSLHELHVHAFVIEAKGWFTSRDVVTATNMAPRTVRRHLRRFVDLGLLARVRAFGGCRYKRTLVPGDHAVDYLAELEAVRESFLETRGAIRATFAAFRRMLGGYQLATG